jgi:uncharacterized membrane protein
MTFTSLLAHIARVFEGIGAGVLVVGLLWSAVSASRAWRVGGGRRGYQVLRESFGAVLLLGLEILVAADLITTVAVAPTPRNVAVLGLIVLIRTFLSVSLQVEIDGRLPWRRSADTGGGSSKPGQGVSLARPASLSSEPEASATAPSDRGSA